MFSQPNYFWIKFLDHFHRVTTRIQNTMRKGVSCNEKENQNKQNYLSKSEASSTKIIFFVFRDFHWVDWFFPIHKKLDELYPKQFQVFYISFFSALKRVGSLSEQYVIQKSVEERLVTSGISAYHHIPSEQIDQFKNFPDPDLILTTEGIRQESFKTLHRVYLPHYFVLKSKDVLPQNIKYNHIFIPSKFPFSYKQEELDKHGVTSHFVGYPKMHSGEAIKAPTFAQSKKKIIYAPSLEIDIIKDSLNKGIIQVFGKMNHLDFIIKLHPALASRGHYIGTYIRKVIKKFPNIYIDSNSNIHDLSLESSLLIADYGNVGAEYHLSTGKRIIYLDVPKSMEGGSDLLYRDRFADAATNIKNLEKHIDECLQRGDLMKKEKHNIGKEVLYNFGFADESAAKAIATILEV